MNTSSGTNVLPRMSVRPCVARHGEMVILSVRGLAPFQRVEVHGRATTTDDEIDHIVRTDRSGRIDTAIRLPKLDESQFWVFAAQSNDGRVSLVADDVLVRPSLQ